MIVRQRQIRLAREGVYFTLVMLGMIGGAVVFLASKAAAYVNGHVLAVDGGLSVTL